jgi:hypothetical protein
MLATVKRESSAPLTLSHVFDLLRDVRDIRFGGPAGAQQFGVAPRT